MSSDPVVVQALYSFKASNNDELCFKKGDLITITQKDDGGWWEGTLGDVTGWFPVNYVREVKDASIVQQLSTMQPDVHNLSIVYHDLLESEKAHVAELQGLLNNFLIPLEKSTILNQDEYKQLTANFLEVLETHQELLRLIEGENQKTHREQRIGKVFLNYAKRMKNVHQMYRSLHPKAVCIIDKYRDELSKYMESCGANCPGVLVLTTGLSKPFRRMAKYSGMLLEVERHVEDSHPDRGDIQRSVAIYKEIEAACEATRRQKEIELQILTGPVRGWEGQSLASLGDIIYMGSVAVGPQHLDRYLILFPSTLLILSISHRLSGFIYEGKLPVTGINVTKLEDNDQYKNAFEISGPMIEKLIAVCQSREEANYWVELLNKHNPNKQNYGNKVLPSQVEFIPQPPPHLNPRGYSNRMSIIGYQPSLQYTNTLPCQFYPPAAPYAGLTKLYAQMKTIIATNGSRHGGTMSTSSNSSAFQNNNKGWSVNCLRCAPPIRPCTSLLTNRQNGKSYSYKEDALILEVVEAYFSIKARQTVNSADISSTDSAHRKPLNANEQLIRLQQRLKNVECNVELLSSQLTEERTARCALQSLIQRLLPAKEFESIEWPAMESNIMS